MPADTMLGAAFNADKVFSAECGSLNSSAETLSDPMIWAWVERWRTIACRKVIRSYAKNAPQANSRAAPLTSMFIPVSILEIEYWRTLSIVGQSPSGELLLTLIANLSNWELDRKSTRLNSSHLVMSYAVFCL